MPEASDSPSISLIQRALNIIGAENIVNGLIFLALDLFIVFVVINGILSWRDRSRWAPLRKDVFLQGYNLAFLILHGVRSALKQDKQGSIDAASVNAVIHFINEAKRANARLSKRLALYGSGLGENMLPQMAVINEECEEMLVHLEFSVLPFLPQGEGETSYYFNAFPTERIDRVIDSLIEIKSNHSKGVVDKEISKEEVFDAEWITQYYEALAKANPRVVLHVGDIAFDKAEELIVLGTRELTMVGNSELVKNLKIRTLRSF